MQSFATSINKLSDQGRYQADVYEASNGMTSNDASAVIKKIAPQSNGDNSGFILVSSAVHLEKKMN